MSGGRWRLANGRHTVPVMCGRYAQTRSVESVRAWSGATNPPVNLAANWNVAPTQTAPVVRRHPETGERHLDLLRWGVVPRWAKDLKHRPQPTNARAETVATSPMFRDAFHKRRCIVPAEAFYEWRAEPDGKAPFAIGLSDGEPLAFAGIWDGWKSPEGEVVRTFAIVTTDANAEMRAVHTRMPVILAPADWPAMARRGRRRGPAAPSAGRGPTSLAGVARGQQRAEQWA